MFDVLSCCAFFLSSSSFASIFVCFVFTVATATTSSIFVSSDALFSISPCFWTSCCDGSDVVSSGCDATVAATATFFSCPRSPCFVDFCFSPTFLLAFFPLIMDCIFMAALCFFFTNSTKLFAADFVPLNLSFSIAFWMSSLNLSICSSKKSLMILVPPLSCFFQLS